MEALFVEAMKLVEDGNTAFGAGKWKTAHQLFSQAEVAALKGMREVKGTEAGEELFSSGVQLPYLSACAVGRVRSAVKLGRYTEAIAKAQATVELHKKEAMKKADDMKKAKDEDGKPYLEGHGDSTDLAQLHFGMGAALVQAGKAEEAMEHFTTCQQLFEAGLAPIQHSISTVLQQSRAQTALGNLDTAETMASEILGAMSAGAVPVSDEEKDGFSAEAHLVAGLAQLAANKYDDAQASFQGAWDVKEAAVGEEPRLFYAECLLNQGRALQASGNRPRALTRFGEALKTLFKVFGTPDHPMFVQAMNGAISTMVASGFLPEARRVRKHAWAIVGRLVDSDRVVKVPRQSADKDDAGGAGSGSGSGSGAGAGVGDEADPESKTTSDEPVPERDAAMEGDISKFMTALPPLLVVPNPPAPRGGDGRRGGGRGGGRGRGRRDYRHQQQRRPRPDTSDKLCRFFNSPAGCPHGDACRFKHERVVCKAFLTSIGCRFGDLCMFLHSEA